MNKLYKAASHWATCRRSEQAGHCTPVRDLRRRASMPAPSSIPAPAPLARRLARADHTTAGTHPGQGPRPSPSWVDGLRWPTPTTTLLRDQRLVGVYLAGCWAKAPAHPSEQKQYSTPWWVSRPALCQGSTAIRQTGSIGSPAALRAPCRTAAYTGTSSVTLRNVHRPRSRSSTPSTPPAAAPAPPATR